MKTVNAIGAPESGLAAPPPPRVLDQVRARSRVLHYSIRTEQAYVNWIKRYILSFDKQHPRGLAAGHLERFFKDRVTMLPQALTSPLQSHLHAVHMLHQRDLAAYAAPHTSFAVSTTSSSFAR